MANQVYPHVIPVSLLTGFLGSGKTTVLNHLLQQPDMARTAVVINEFGEIGIDHELVEAATESLVLLQSGCLCCTIRGDLVETLHSLVGRREHGDIEWFDRVIIETTGLADPAPILHTLMTDSFIMHTFRLDGVIVTVDAAAGSSTLDAQLEAVKQAAMADRILLTKTDLVELDAVKALQARLQVLNPGATIIPTHNGAVEPASLFNAGLYNPKSKSIDAQTWLNAEAYNNLGNDHAHDHGNHDSHQHHDSLSHHRNHSHKHDVNRHDDRISAVANTIEQPIAADIFDYWLETLMLLRGRNILRMKGIVNVEGARAPFVLHGVQHIIHPPVVLRHWPSEDRRSRFVLIGRDLTNEFLMQSFGFLGSGDQRGSDDKDSAKRAV